MIDKILVPYIEKALNIKLYDNVKAYLTEDKTIHYDKNNRRCGKTTAFIIKYILENSDKTIKFSDLIRGGHTDEIWDTNYIYWYYHEFMNIRDKLEHGGFKVVKIE